MRTTPTTLPATATTATLLLATCLALTAQAQSYTLVDLTPTTAYNSVNALSPAGAVGFTAPTISLAQTHATLWDGSNATDLHPAWLDANGTIGRSSAMGIADTLQVGWGAGASTGNRPTPLMWRGTAASATVLTIPFVNAGAQATATDGTQIVGYGTALNRDGTAFGPSRAILWDAASGAAVDLGDGGGGAVALGVGGGKQVGYVFKALANAAVWSGSSKSLVVMHPKGAVISAAYGTDGARQVGYSGYDVRVRVEAVKGNKDARFYYATVWNGTSASAQIIHPFSFAHSYATAVNGTFIAGYAADQTKLGTPAYYHAIVWDTDFQPIDLNAYLPSGYVGSQAFAVDAHGNVAGSMVAADGTRHAVLWMLNQGR